MKLKPMMMAVTLILVVLAIVFAGHGITLLKESHYKGALMGNAFSIEKMKDGMEMEEVTITIDGAEMDETRMASHAMKISGHPNAAFLGIGKILIGIFILMLAMLLHMIMQPMVMHKNGKKK